MRTCTIISCRSMLANRFSSMHSLKSGSRGPLRRPRDGNQNSPPLQDWICTKSIFRSGGVPWGFQREDWRGRKRLIRRPAFRELVMK